MRQRVTFLYAYLTAGFDSQLNTRLLSGGIGNWERTVLQADMVTQEGDLKGGIFAALVPTILTVDRTDKGRGRVHQWTNGALLRIFFYSWEVRCTT